MFTDWERLQLRESDYKNHRIFILRCLHKDLVPFSIKLKSTLKTERARKIVRKAEKDLIQARIKAINSILGNIGKQTEICRSNLASIISAQRLRECQGFIDKVGEIRFNKVKQKQLNKFPNLVNKKEGNITRVSNNNSPQTGNNLAASRQAGAHLPSGEGSNTPLASPFLSPREGDGPRASQAGSGLGTHLPSGEAAIPHPRPLLTFLQGKEAVSPRQLLPFLLGKEAILTWQLLTFLPRKQAVPPWQLLTFPLGKEAVLPRQLLTFLTGKEAILPQQLLTFLGKQAVPPRQLLTFLLGKEAVLPRQLLTFLMGKEVVSPKPLVTFLPGKQAVPPRQLLTFLLGKEAVLPRLILIHHWGKEEVIPRKVKLAIKLGQAGRALGILPGVGLPKLPRRIVLPHRQTSLTPGKAPLLLPIGYPKGLLMKNLTVSGSLTYPANL